MASTSTYPLPGRSVSSSSSRSLTRPSLNPSALNTSTHSLTPLGSSDSSSSSLPQRNSSTSSQSSTASIPARPIRPPPIETRTKTSAPEQVWGAQSLRDALAPPPSRRFEGNYSSPNSSGSSSPALSERTPVQPQPPRSTNTGFVVTAGRRGSAGTSSPSAASSSPVSVATPVAKRNPAGSVAGGMAIGPSCFKFGEELGRGSFSVVRQATLLSNSTTYAIKILDKHHLRTHKKEKYASVEVEALKRLSTATFASPTSPTSTSRPPMPRKRSSQSALPKSPSDRTIRASSSPSRATLEGAGLVARTEEVLKGKQKAKAGHPGVIKLTWAFQDMSSLYFVLELVTNGEILALIRKVGSFSVPCARHYAAELVDILGWIHSKGILHRDLKPENVLLDADFHCRLTDFGSAKVYPIVEGKVVREIESALSAEPAPEGIPGSNASRTAPKRSFVGTAEYVSPEVLLNEGASESSDFWALGCILFQFLAGSPPFRGRTEYLTFQKIKALEYTFPDGFDPGAKDLIERLLVLDPSQRLGAGPSGIQEIKDHPFLRGTDFSTLWSKPPPPLESGLVGPPQPVAPRDFFAELGLDDVQESEEEEEEADDGMGAISPSMSEPRITSDDEDFEPPKGRWAHKVRHGAKGGSVSSGTASIGTLDPSSAVAQAIVGLGKGRPASINTSISSGYTGGPYSPIGTNSNSPIIPSPADQDRTVSGPWQSPTSKTQKKSIPLLPDEKVVFSTAILVPSSPSIVKSLNPLAKPPRERFLILTDFPRLLCVKQDHKGEGSFKLKYECLIVRRGTGSGIGSGAGGGANVLKSVKEKGAKGFSVHTSSSSSTHIFVCDDDSTRKKWMEELQAIQE